MPDTGRVWLHQRVDNADSKRHSGGSAASSNGWERRKWEGKRATETELENGSRELALREQRERGCEERVRRSRGRRN
eukprot:2166617-Rhodomonas_salina.1